MAELTPNSKIALDLSCLGIAEQWLDAHIPFDDGMLFDRFTIYADAGEVSDQLLRWLIGAWPQDNQTAKGQ